jgi:ATP-dependent RNA helicase RhlE
VALLRQMGNGQALIFTRTKHRAKKLAEQLAKAGLMTTSLQGNLSQSQRQAAMDSFRSGRARIMVATDIAARGIDVLGISHVINYDMPDTADAYTHRIGRTGRMTRHGAALSLVTQDDMPMIRTIERLLGQKLERCELEGFTVTPLIERPEAVKYMYQSSKSRPIISPPRRSTRAIRSVG